MLAREGEAVRIASGVPRVDGLCYDNTMYRWRVFGGAKDLGTYQKFRGQMNHGMIKKRHKWNVMTLDSRKPRPNVKYVIFEPMQWKIWRVL